MLCRNFLYNQRPTLHPEGASQAGLIPERRSALLQEPQGAATHSLETSIEASTQAAPQQTQQPVHDEDNRDNDAAHARDICQSEPQQSSLQEQDIVPDSPEDSQGGTGRQLSSPDGQAVHLPRAPTSPRQPSGPLEPSHPDARRFSGSQSLAELGQGSPAADPLDPLLMSAAPENEPAAGLEEVPKTSALVDPAGRQLGRSEGSSVPHTEHTASDPEPHGQQQAARVETARVVHNGFSPTVSPVAVSYPSTGGAHLQTLPSIPLYHPDMDEIISGSPSMDDSSQANAVPLGLTALHQSPAQDPPVRVDGRSDSPMEALSPPVASLQQGAGISQRENTEQTGQSRLQSPPLDLSRDFQLFSQGGAFAEGNEREGLRRDQGLASGEGLSTEEVSKSERSTYPTTGPPDPSALPSDPAPEEGVLIPESPSPDRHPTATPQPAPLQLASADPREGVQRSDAADQDMNPRATAGLVQADDAPELEKDAEFDRGQAPESILDFIYDSSELLGLSGALNATQEEHPKSVQEQPSQEHIRVRRLESADQVEETDTGRISPQLLPAKQAAAAGASQQGDVEEAETSRQDQEANEDTPGEEPKEAGSREEGHEAGEEVAADAEFPAQGKEAHDRVMRLEDWHTPKVPSRTEDIQTANWVPASESPARTFQPAEVGSGDKQGSNLAKSTEAKSSPESATKPSQPSRPNLSLGHSTQKPPLQPGPPKTIPSESETSDSVGVILEELVQQLETAQVLGTSEDDDSASKMVQKLATPPSEEPEQPEWAQEFASPKAAWETPLRPRIHGVQSQQVAETPVLSGEGPSAAVEFRGFLSQTPAETRGQKPPRGPHESVEGRPPKTALNNKPFMFESPALLRLKREAPAAGFKRQSLVSHCWHSVYTPSVLINPILPKVVTCSHKTITSACRMTHQLLSAGLCSLQIWIHSLPK